VPGLAGSNRKATSKRLRRNGLPIREQPARRPVRQAGTLQGEEASNGSLSVTVSAASAFFQQEGRMGVLLVSTAPVVALMLFGGLSVWLASVFQGLTAAKVTAVRRASFQNGSSNLLRRRS
jgi:hypothetical protein